MYKWIYLFMTGTKRKPLSILLTFPSAASVHQGPWRTMSQKQRSAFSLISQNEDTLKVGIMYGRRQLCKLNDSLIYNEIHHRLERKNHTMVNFVICPVCVSIGASSVYILGWYWSTDSAVTQTSVSTHLFSMLIGCPDGLDHFLREGMHFRDHEAILL